ncbi:hypothetical protein Hypma_003201 [Hypsizygus marmoreus]|uniref:Uncharacterized protein n=1 Tax=Hypsizygus marmoreus TaxID=39966 RepID=A0A369K7I2_HYPMA|nr:hypothetical protein Hypma_003201 [Hypsizygus marmoreus]
MAPSRSVMQFYSVLAESFLEGVYAVLVSLVIWILITSYHSMSTMHKVLFGSSITMFFIAAAHLALLIQEASVGVFPSPPVGKAIIILSVFQFVTGDLVLLWRVWVIWGRNYFVAAGPFVTIIIAAGFTINLAARPTINNFFHTVPVVLIVANTCICTLLIAGRVWYMQYCLKKIANCHAVLCPENTYKGAVALIIESGALYAACQLISLALHYVGSNGLSVMLNLEMPLIGILPTLIIVLVHFNMVPGTETTRHYAAAMKSQSSTNITLDTLATGTMILDEQLHSPTYYKSEA